jgi:hypothetical protein
MSPGSEPESEPESVPQPEGESGTEPQPEGESGTEPEGESGSASRPQPESADDRAVVRVTRGLVEYLLDWAGSSEPERLSAVLGSTPAREFEADLGLGADAPVLTHLYLPEAGGSVNAVFGMDLGTPAGRGRARFVTHPRGPLGVTRRDDLAAVVLVAVPPWDERSLAAFDRAGRRLDLRVIDAEPPHGELDTLS